MEHIATCLTEKYLDFNSRSSRSEFWTFYIFSILFLGFIEFIRYSAPPGVRIFIDIFASLTGLYMIIPNLTASVRRLHDINKSGWFMLMSCIPIAGSFALFLMWTQPSTTGTNRFGEEPS